MKKLTALLSLLLVVNLVWAQRPRLVLPIGHTYNIQGLAISPDGKYAATSSSDKTIRLWELKTGRQLQTLAGKIKDIRFVYFSPDGAEIIAGAKDGKIKGWNIFSGKEILSVDGLHHELAAMRMSKDGRLILSAGCDSTAKIWDARSGELLHTLKGHSSFVSDACFGFGDEKVLTASWDLTLKIWDTKGGQLLQSLTGLKAFPNNALFSPDNNYIVATAAQQGLVIWDAVTGKIISEPAYKPEKINSITFLKEGKYFATGSSDHSVRIWETATGKQLFNLVSSDSEEVNIATESPDKKFIACGGDASIMIWDLSDGKLVHTLKGHGQDIKGLQYSPDGKKLVSASWDKTARVWETGTGECQFILTGHSVDFSYLFFNPNYRKLISTASLLSSDCVWDPSTLHFTKLVTALANSNSIGPSMISHDASFYVAGHEIRNFETDRPAYRIKDTLLNSLVDPIFSNDGKWLVVNMADYEKKIYTIQLRQAGDGKLVRILRGLSDAVWFTNISPDNKYIYASSMDDKLTCWEIATGKIIYTLNRDVQSKGSLAFSPNNKLIATSSPDKAVSIWDRGTGKLLKKLQGHTWIAFNLQFSPDGRYLLSSSTGYGPNTIIWETASWKKICQVGDEAGENYVANKAGFSTTGRYFFVSLSNSDGEIRETTTGKLLHTLKGHSDELFTIVADKNDHFAYSLSRDNQIRCWNIETGALVSYFFVIDSLDYFAQIPTGYYQSTSAAAKLLHYVTSDFRIISFEQLDVKYNRPDKVLEAIGNTDTALIKSYHKAYEKRIKKLGIDTTAFRDDYSVPEADFTNRDNVEYEQKNEQLTLNIKGLDSTYKLDRFNVWVNEVPVFGLKGKSIRFKNSNSFDTIVTIKLSQGENRIETSITNVNGTESYRMPLIVKYTPAKPLREMAYFLGIGIDQFAENKYNLQYSSKDIRDLSLKLKSKYGNDIVIDTLFNENVTVNNVKALKKKLQRTTENDKVIIAYSGHGLLSKDYDYYLSTYAVNFEQPEQNGLPYDELENLLDSIPARKKLMLIDACHSGEVDKEEGIAMNITAESIGLSRGVIIPAAKQQQVGLKNSFELMQSLFVNVGKSTGATIISAAAGNQFALERGDLKNGVFTFAILEAIKNHPTIKISELKKIVGERVEQLTKGMQKPTSRNETIAVDWNVW